MSLYSLVAEKFRNSDVSQTNGASPYLGDVFYERCGGNADNAAF